MKLYSTNMFGWLHSLPQKNIVEVARKINRNDPLSFQPASDMIGLNTSLGGKSTEGNIPIRKFGEIVRSSNYALYGDLSERVMSILAEEAPQVEVYSIDECFLDLHRLAVPDLATWCLHLRRKVRLWTGIPVSIGIGPNKTLAKLANKLAKASLRTGGVLDLVHNPHWVEPALKKAAINDVWGIGSRWAAMLKAEGILTAYDLSCAQDSWVRKRMGIVGLRTVHELRGMACYDLETQPAPKKTTCCSRSFGQAVTQKSEVKSAVISFAERTSEKVRRDSQVAAALQVFVTTDRFNKSAPQYSSAATVRFVTPTSDALHIVRAASGAFENIWRSGFAFRKAGVLLLDLSAKDEQPATLFDYASVAPDHLMQAVDAINQRFGRGSIALGMAPKSRSSAWAMRQEKLSARFTTRWADLATAHTRPSPQDPKPLKYP